MTTSFWIRGALGILLAVSCSTEGTKNPGPPADKPQNETMADIFARKLAYTKAHPFFQELHTPHLQRFLPQTWNPEADEILVDADWSLRTEGRMEIPGPFAGQEMKSFFHDTAGFDLKEGGCPTEIVLKVAGRPADRRDADSYSIEATENRIVIAAKSWSGALYGVYYLEQVFLERGIPAFKPQSIHRRPVYDVRMFGDMYGTFTVSGLRIEKPVKQSTFSALSRFGANATFTFTQLGDYLGETGYPELANPDREKNFVELAKLAALAKSAGVDLYLDAYNPKLPGTHPVFQAHPNAQGASQHGRDIHSLCPSDPETLKIISSGWAEVFRRVPDLGGMVAIIGGEGFYHCYMRSGEHGPDCPRCREQRAEDVVADLTNAVFRAIRAVKPDAEFFAWPYSAFVWSKDPFQLDLIGKLDPGIHIVPEIDKDYVYPKDGYAKNIWDYSIDFLGPSPRYEAISEAARRRGLKIACKTESAVSLEMHGVPFNPSLQRWGKRFEIIRDEHPDSIYYAYDITGFARSRPEELAGRLSWAPAGSAADEIRRMAVRDFGPKAAPAVVDAWDKFSEAMGHTPYLTHGYYKGPSFIGPGQPLMLTEENLPEALYGRFFYLAEEDLSEGTSEATLVRPIYTADIKISPAEMADMDRAVALWDKGAAIFRNAEPPAAEPWRREFLRERDLALYIQTLFRAISHSNHFFTLRAEYRELTKDPAGIESVRTKALALLDEMGKIVEADLENARRGLEIAERDPRLDLSVRLDLDYRPLAEIIAAKIRYGETVVRAQLEAERKKLGG